MCGCVRPGVWSALVPPELCPYQHLLTRSSQFSPITATAADPRRDITVFIIISDK